MTDMELSKAVQSDTDDVGETRPSGDTQLIIITVTYLKMRKKERKHIRTKVRQRKINQKKNATH